MKKKCLIFFAITAIFLAPLSPAFSQDTSKLQPGKNLRNNSDTLNAAVNPNARNVNPAAAPGTPHASINPNSGTAIPSTTSGTLNSTVNPNTQFVIPLHKNKRKSNPNTIPDTSGITLPR